jgi:hypothetical protein
LVSQQRQEYDKYKDDPRMPVFAEKPSYEIEVDFD